MFFSVECTHGILLSKQTAWLALVQSHRQRLSQKMSRKKEWIQDSDQLKWYAARKTHSRRSFLPSAEAPTFDHVFDGIFLDEETDARLARGHVCHSLLHCHEQRTRISSATEYAERIHAEPQNCYGRCSHGSSPEGRGGRCKERGYEAEGARKPSVPGEGADSPLALAFLSCYHPRAQGYIIDALTSLRRAGFRDSSGALPEGCRAGSHGRLPKSIPNYMICGNRLRKTKKICQCRVFLLPKRVAHDTKARTSMQATGRSSCMMRIQ